MDLGDRDVSLLAVLATGMTSGPDDAKADKNDWGTVVTYIKDERAKQIAEALLNPKSAQPNTEVKKAAEGLKDWAICNQSVHSVHAPKK